MAQSFDLYSSGGILLSAGQATMAYSVPVTIASDQTSIPISIQNSQQYQIFSVIDGVLLASTVIKPEGMTVNPYLENPTANYVRISSSSSSDNGNNYTIVGYDDSGSLLSEVITCNGQTPVSSSNQYCGLTKFFATTAITNYGNIFAYDSSATVSIGTPNQAIAEIAPGTNTSNAFINWLAIPAGSSLNIKKIVFTLVGNTLNHSCTLRQVDNSVNVGSSTNRRVQTWGITTGTNTFDYNGELLIQNMSTVKNYIWIEVNFSGSDINSRLTIDCTFTI